MFNWQNHSRCQQAGAILGWDNTIKEQGELGTQICSLASFKVVVSCSQGRQGMLHKPLFKPASVLHLNCLADMLDVSCCCNTSQLGFRMHNKDTSKSTVTDTDTNTNTGRCTRGEGGLRRLAYGILWYHVTI